MIPSRLGPYHLEEILGRGGMGTVYRAVDPESGECVAIKILAPDLAADPSFLERFQEEVQTLLQLKHPSIVQLLSFGKQEEVFYFAMELVEGKSLYAMQKAGYHFTYLETVEIGIKVCEGLHHSHNLGVVHRDLKPGNIIMANDGQIKLADYGIAKRFGGQQMTMVGVLGTAEFMSPEQAQGKPATIQSDLYSLGAVLFALATGKPPLLAATPQKTLEKVVTKRAPLLTSIAKDAPMELELLIEKLLKKQPENRYRSARSVSAKLAEILELLRERAEMETNLVLADDPPNAAPAGAAINAGSPTLVDASPSSKAAFAKQPSPANATRPQTERQADKSASRPSRDLTLRDENDPALSPNRVIREQDFFERAVYAPAEEEATEAASPWVTLLLALGLLTLVSISGYLVYDRVIRDRTADELWTMIDANQERPMGVGKEMDAFLRLYPDDPRAVEVEELQAKATAFQYRNALNLRASMNRKDLSDLERQFLKLTTEDSESKWEKEVALQALITYYSADSEEQSAGVQDCLEAAETYRRMYRKLALPEVEAKINEIQARIEAAERLKFENPEQAEQIRKSLLELFGDKRWADPLISPLRDRRYTQ